MSLHPRKTGVDSRLGSVCDSSSLSAPISPPDSPITHLKRPPVRCAVSSARHAPCEKPSSAIFRCSRPVCCMVNRTVSSALLRNGSLRACNSKKRNGYQLPPLASGARNATPGSASSPARLMMSRALEQNHGRVGSLECFASLRQILRRLIHFGFPRSLESTMIVTGPSFTSATFMSV